MMSSKRIPNHIREYGPKPYRIAVIHGGPGATGEMKPVALELSKYAGVVEPLQTAHTLEEQVHELKDALEQYNKPLILIGYSWGAWLAFILTARYGKMVEKLILIGSGPFETKYAEDIMQTRLARLNPRDRLAMKTLIEALSAQKTASNYSLEMFGKLVTKSDSYKPIAGSSAAIRFDQEIYQKVWPEAESLRKSGALLELGKNIKCPVVAIHGEYDPHPSDGVRRPLSRILENFDFITLKKCGHCPWIEQEAKNKFYQLLKQATTSN